jgi:hypothetical protein
MVSGVSPAAGQKNGRSNRKRKLISDRINRMDRINILNQKNPDNPVNPVKINEVSYKVSGVRELRC